MTYARKQSCPRPLALGLALLLAGLSAPASAELARLGAVDRVTGYPAWYQDFTGLALDLCMPDPVDLAAGNCLLLPPDVPLGTVPESFPSNFAEEHFWFAADATLAANAKRAVLVLAVEGAFGGGAAKQGDQIAFGRIRVRIDNLPSNGTYIVTHPYGVLTFPDQVAGDRIAYTDDVGINCAAGDFSCALKTGIGPYLRAATTAGGPALPFVTINGKTMLADPTLPTAVTGGPFGNKFRIDGPNIGGAGVHFIETQAFTLMGRVHTAPIPSPLRAERAGYMRNATSSWIDVFASAAAGIGKAAPNLGIAGHGIVPKVMLPDGKGGFWGQTNVSSANVPSQVEVTNSGDVPPTVISVPVTDLVTITEAQYDPVARQLFVKAKTSDEGANPPRLILPDFNGTATDNVGGATLSDIAVPPRTVTVTSAAGGTDTAPVLAKQAAAVSLVLPDLTQSGNEDTMLVFSIAPAGGGFAPGSFRVLSQPAHGALTVDANGNASYMPASNYEGSDSFTYVVANTDGTDSSIVTVGLTVLPVNDPPVANADAATTVLGQAVVIPLLANDVDPDLTTGIDPATVTVVTRPAQGTLTISNGLATYTPAASGIFTFTYTVADRAGVVSNPATVTVTVQGIETIAVAAGAEYRADQQRWKVSGTSSVRAGQTVSIRPRNSATGALGGVVGTAVVDAAGAWILDARAAALSGTGFNQVQVTSPLGGSGIGALRLK